MKYYKVTIDQEVYCGCYHIEYLTANNREEVETLVNENAYDILAGMIDADDEDSEWWTTINYTIEEISKEEWEGEF